MSQSHFHGRPHERIVAQRFRWERARYRGWWETRYVAVVLVQQGHGLLAEPEGGSQALEAGAVCLIAPRRPFRIEPQDDSALIICRCQMAQNRVIPYITILAN